MSLNISTIENASKHALQNSSLIPFDTEVFRYRDNNLDYILRVASKQNTKDELKTIPRKNPFTNIEPDLFITQINKTHNLILNKYPFMPLHLLIATRDFHPQTEKICKADLKAVSELLNQFDGLVFFNSSAIAGASQKHKHLQFIPFCKRIADIAPLFMRSTQPELPFTYFLTHPDNITPQSLYHAYEKLFQQLNAAQINNYNLLFSRQWMLLVPRSSEKYQDISINALGFCGSLLVRSHRQRKFLENKGIATALKHVTI